MGSELFRRLPSVVRVATVAAWVGCAGTALLLGAQPVGAQELRAKAEKADDARPVFHTAIREVSDPAKAVAFPALVKAQTGPLDEIRDKAGRTPLHYAVAASRADAAALLMIHGASVAAVDDQGETPLFTAVRRKRHWIVRELIAAGADVNHVNKAGETPLAVAIKDGQPADARVLLLHGAKPRLAQASEALQPEKLALAKGREAFAAEFQRYSEGVSQKGKPEVPPLTQNELHEAARKGWTEGVQAYLAQGVSVNLKDEAGYTPLHHAVKAGDEGMVLLLLKQGADPNLPDARGMTPLMTTMYWLGASHNHIRRLLLLAKASPTAEMNRGFNVLTWAAERGNEHGAQIAIWFGADPGEKTGRGTPFQIAFKAGRQGIMDLLTLYGVGEPIVLSEDPVWNLHNGVCRGDRQLVEAMLAAGTPVDAPDENGNSPLMAAIAARNLSIIPLLSAKGADINFRNAKDGSTPLHRVMAWNYREAQVLEAELILAGVNLNAADANGVTPLMRGLERNVTPGLRQLVEAGADLNLRNNEGRTALGIALHNGHTATAAYLRSHGAQE